MARLAVLLLALVVLVPVPLAAQVGSEPIEPILPPEPCPAFDCWWPEEPVATLEELRVELEVRDGVAVGEYELLLANHGFGLAEGRIVVPVPPNSSVTDLALSDGQQTLEGRVLDAGEALRIYEEIVRRLIDPALLQSLGETLYEVRAFPVPAGEQRTVRFTVTTPLVADGDQAMVQIPWSRMSPRPASALVNVEVDVPWEVRAAVAPTFALSEERLGPGRLRLSWESSGEWRPDLDFTLYLTGGEGLLTTRVLPYRTFGEAGYFALLLAPVVETDARVDRDVIVVVDTSGSMEGEKIAQAKAAARFILERLGTGDRFAIVEFDRLVSVFDGGLQPVFAVEEGLAFVEGMRAGGSTNIAGALATAFGLATGQRPATVVFLTDGLATVGPESTEAILTVAEASAAGRTQAFTFGVGYDVDTVLLDSIASRFVGTSHYVTPEERIDSEVGRLYERIATPVLTEVEVTFEGGQVFDVVPAVLTGIFAGTQVLVTGRYGEAGPIGVTVSGSTGTGSESLHYALVLLELESADPSVAQLWAQQRVADLLTELRVEGVRDSLIAEIVAVATQFGIVTPYTSYLAEDPDLAFLPEEAAEAVADDAIAAPTTGEDAVGGASDVEELREGDFDLGGETVRVLGSHRYFLIDGVWVQEGYDAGQPTRLVVVGSGAFAELVSVLPEAAQAAVLGERVIVVGPTGPVLIVWPDATNPGDVVLISAETPGAPGPGGASAAGGAGGAGGEGGGSQAGGDEPPRAGVTTPLTGATAGAADGAPERAPSRALDRGAVDADERTLWWVGAGVTAAAVLLFSVALFGFGGLGPGRLGWGGGCGGGAS